MQQLDSTGTSADFNVNNFQQLSIRYDHATRALWYQMAPEPRPCFNPVLLAEIRRFQNLVRTTTLERSHCTPLWTGVKYLVLSASVEKTPGVFSLGGDLNLFRECIRRGDRESLRHYARACIDVLYPNSMDLDLPLTTISLVQGSALGGGMEAALSSTVVIAERSTQMGLPEILFGLFPGMGAYPLLARRIGVAQAERFIKSGRTYNAQELYDMGLVDVVAADGQGEKAVTEYIRRQDSVMGAYEALHRIRRLTAPVSHEELLQVTDLWVDTALQLGERELRVMERLARSQDRLLTRARSRMGDGIVKRSPASEERSALPGQ